ncbi:MAG: alpha/beta hydrolase [Pseudomonadota bacterium]
MTFSFAGLSHSDVSPLVFLPGWGFDGRLISLFRLFPARRIIMPDSFLHPSTLERDLFAFLGNHGAGISIVGWSMGAQLGLDFSCAHPELVDRLTLVSMRQYWPLAEIQEIRKGLEEDWRDFMRGFYRKCFLGYKKEYRQFVAVLEDDYLNRLDLKTLWSGLDYLERFRVPSPVPDAVPVSVLHGRKDVVAPVGEMVQLGAMECDVIAHGGHMVLLDRMR